MRENEGEAASYGITYDDSKYDYMSHLRPVQGGFDSFMIPAPRGSGVAKGMKGDRKGKQKDLFVAEDFLASQEEVPLNEVYNREEAIPQELQGLQPDMDPHLRQVLEALDDEAFIDGEDEEEEGGEFWGDLVAGGEADEYEREDFEFEEWGVDEERKERKVAQKAPEDETWEDRFKAFKQAQKTAGSEGEIERSEMADTLGSMVSGMEDLMVKGGKKRRGKRGPSDASGMSMSSSSMFRTQGLRDLDARFDKVGLSAEERMSNADARSSGTMRWKTMMTRNGTTERLWLGPRYPACRGYLACPACPRHPEHRYIPILQLHRQRSQGKTSIRSWTTSWTTTK